VNRRRADADVFQAIAHPTRRELLDTLARGERPVLALAERFNVSVPAVSQHLGVLRAAGLVGERRDGRQRIYHLDPEPLREVSQWMRLYEHFWSEKLDALGNFLARAHAAPATPPEPPARRKVRRK
jgi:DNA-binding transcriptional ArsR family regulator